ncbi:ArsR/SmtB family transcription factor [Streptomyces chiangmaiensis]|uniref:Metalloregulator ArsR/SmtB family transcription factor n=1 Tax=Streptomyces chiangmaiensis TaxID=766497 RepID=A0ABU7FLQ3_9ACTN|nr:metalloregulator ArsR/SmtB family transcription factor [Streptomyces chiangmaiensis]MED7825041.1 metalloregulator ArsR/SmtB family transcription factor [Streptomyces chiangmaiensis]
MATREVREKLFVQLARIGKSISHPKRIELLEILGQGERSVEALAAATAMGVSNTSAHLQVLRSARMVETRKQGTKVIYSLADELVAGFVRELWNLADARLAEVEQLIRQYLEGGETLERVTREELICRALKGDVYIIDVRPLDEYAAGHIPGAASVPFDELVQLLSTLPADMDIVAYCRGPHCVLAPKAAQILRQHGFRALVLADGMPEWRQEGLPVDVTDS